VLGAENLEEFIARNNPREVILQECVGAETIRLVTLGQMAREAGGLNDGTVTCLLEETESLNFRKLIFQDEVGPEFGELIQSYALCLSDEELLQVMGFASGDRNLNAAQLRCILSANPRAVFGMIERPSPQFAELFDKCGIPLEVIGEPAVPPPLSAEEEACLIDAMGETAMREVYSGQRPPTPEELAAFNVCYDRGLDSEPGVPDMEFPDFASLPEISAPMEINSVV